MNLVASGEYQRLIFLTPLAFWISIALSAKLELNDFAIRIYYLRYHNERILSHNLAYFICQSLAEISGHL